MQRIHFSFIHSFLHSVEWKKKKMWGQHGKSKQKDHQLSPGLKPKLVMTLILLWGNRINRHPLCDKFWLVSMTQLYPWDLNQSVGCWVGCTCWWCCICNKGSVRMIRKSSAVNNCQYGPYLSNNEDIYSQVLSCVYVFAFLCGHLVRGTSRQRALFQKWARCTTLKWTNSSAAPPHPPAEHKGTDFIN